AADPAVARDLEDVRRPLDVDARVAGRRAERRTDAGEAREVEHAVRAVEARLDRRAVDDARVRDPDRVAELGLEVARVPPLRRLWVRRVAEVVDDDGPVAAREERARQVVADEPDPARDDPG